MAPIVAPRTGTDAAAAGSCSLSNLRIEVHEDFESISHDWKGLESHAVSTPFQSYGWLSAWYDTIGRAEVLKPLFIALRTPHGALEFLLPLAVRDIGPLGWIAGDMGQPVCDYHAPLMTDSFVAAAKPQSMRDLWSRVLSELDGIDSMVLVKQPDLVGFRKNPMTAVCTAPYFTPTAYQTNLRPYDDFKELAKAKRSSKARSRLKSKRNKLKRLGNVTFHCLEAETERRNSLDTLLSLKRRDLQRAGKRHIFDEPGVSEFLKRVTDESQDVKLFELNCGGEAVALVFALCWQKRLHYFIATYRGGDYAQSSPGMLALCDTFEWSLANGYEQFDFTVGDEAYKLDWSDQETRLYSGTFALTPRGRVAERLEAAKLSLKHTIKSSPTMYAAASKLLFHSQR